MNEEGYLVKLLNERHVMIPNDNDEESWRNIVLLGLKAENVLDL